MKGVGLVVIMLATWGISVMGAYASLLWVLPQLLPTAVKIRALAAILALPIGGLIGALVLLAGRAILKRV
jgi:hypothetical protein